jgi:hypothetical protein
MDISRDVAEALREDASRAFAEQYLDVLTTNWRELKSTVRKTLGWLLISAAAFELIRSAQLREATVAGLKVSDFSDIEKLLPVVVAYLAFQLLVHRTTTVYYQRLHTQFHGTLHRRLRDKNLHVALRPAANLWWDPSTLAYASGDHGRIARHLGRAWSLATVLGIVLFEALAFVHLFGRYGLDALAILSLALVLLLVARTLAELWLETELSGSAISRRVEGKPSPSNSDPSSPHTN